MDELIICTASIYVFWGPQNQLLFETIRQLDLCQLVPYLSISTNKLLFFKIIIITQTFLLVSDCIDYFKMEISQKKKSRAVRVVSSRLVPLPSAFYHSRKYSLCCLNWSKIGFIQPLFFWSTLQKRLKMETSPVEEAVEAMEVAATDAEVAVSMAEEEDDFEEDLECFTKPIKTIDDIVEYWEFHFSKSTLSCHHFREWWRQRVPRLMAPTPNMDYQSPQAHIDDDMVNSVLLGPLEKFMCADKDPAKVLKTLAELNDPPAVCGKMFKLGETTYSCRDCGHDPTCVLCVDCFKSSEHRLHRYKMSITNGGGYCDCGDAEAWCKDVHCKTHALGVAQSTANKDPASKLPPEIRARTEQVFRAVLNYIYELLTTDSFLMLPADLTYKVENDEAANSLDLEAGMNAMDAISSNDDYATVVYNDEVHTYDEVIQTLPRAVDCDRNAAMGFAQLIDREGRCLVKCSGFQVCSEVKKITERSYARRGGRPLKVVIIRGHVFAHQTFAQRLLTWLQYIMDASAGLRALIPKLLLECPAISSPTASMSSTKVSRLDRWLRKDTVLWKSARTRIHHLLVSSMLLSDEMVKRSFAATYIKAYGRMMKDFILDDHEHSFSVTSLSVQFFTVPTLAHHLIASNDVLAILLTTFMSEYERKKNDKGKLEFQRNINSQAFRRTDHILYDLKYLLTTTPIEAGKEWSNEIRKGFLHGASLLFDILSWIQGMDLQLRQSTHHVEYELEWESAFNLHMKLAPVLALVIKWCSTDRVVFIKTFRMLFKKLHDEHKTDNSSYCSQTVAGIKASCIDYQVSVKPVSMHLPLTRLLAGLSLHMSKFELDFDANEFDIAEKPTCLEMMEPSLRTTVLVAQIQAGMWRRNGYSLIDQVRVYSRDPRFRRDMLDQDIIMLQVAASCMNANDFLINLLNKFQLITWAIKEFDCAEDDSVRQVTTVVEEFLSTLIYIVGERYTPGVGNVTADDNLRREIVQLLCVEPMSHSSLNKALAEDTKRETGMDRVVESVATFKKPTEKEAAAGKGKYELKPEFFNDYNVFFYHYSKEEQSKSEEGQRQRRKLAGEPECNPPPCPPEFMPQFAKLVDILQSDVFLYLMALILERADNLKTRCFSENQVHRALHLISLCLLEEERLMLNGKKDLLNFTGKATEQHNLYGLMLQLVGSQRIESHRDLLNWTLQKWQKLAGLSASPSTTSLMVHCDSAVSLVSSIGCFHESSSGTDLSSQLSGEKEAEKKRMAAERRKKIMDQMKSAQKNFMRENATLFDSTSSGLSRPSSSAVLSEDMLTEDYNIPLPCLGPDRAAPATTDALLTCILCQEDELLQAEGKAMVMAAFVQKSTVLSNRKNDHVKSIQNSPSCTALLPSDLHCALHASSCGHVMHASCWQRCYDDLQANESQRGRMRHPLSFDINKQEFLCPLCRRLSNCVIPLIPQFHVMQPVLSGATTPLPSKVDMEEIAAGEQTEMDVIGPLKIGNEVDFSLPVKIPFIEWIEALKITVKYKKELSPSDGTEGEKPPTTPGDSTEDLHDLLNAPHYSTLQRLMRGLAKTAVVAATAQKLPSMKHYYTCPLDQVVQELDEKFGNQSGMAFSRLFTDREGQELVFSASVFEMMNLFSQAIYRVGLDIMPDLHDERIPLEVWSTCAFTLHASVVAGLDAGKQSVVNSSAMSSRHKDCLAALVRFCGVVGSNFGEPKVIRSHGLMLLSVLAAEEVDDDTNPSILDLDAFGLLVALTFSLPSLFNGDQAAPLPSGNVQDQHLLHLIYVLHLVQIMLTTDQFSTSMDDDQSSSPSEEEDMQPVLTMLHKVRDAVGFASDNDGSEGLNAKLVWNDLVKASLPFLRCAALFYHNLTNVEGPSNLVHLADNEFAVLASYLNLPTNPKDLLLAHPSLISLVQVWTSHPSVYASLAGASAGHHNVTYPLRLNSLVGLPHDYSELINTVSSFKCPNSISDESRVPTMCLICGTVVCSQSHCCQSDLGNGSSVGACTAHAEVCGAGSGIFLRVRECKLVLLTGRTKGCFIEPPYLDQYGETDTGLRRGNPLHLCPEKYRKIYKLWLNHSIPEKISHMLESNQFLIATPWFHL